MEGEKCGLLSPERNLYPNIYGTYDGYGRINGLDVYFMLAVWNRKLIVENYPDIVKYENNKIYDAYFDLNIPNEHFISYEKLKDNIKKNINLRDTIASPEIEDAIRIIGIELYFSNGKEYPYKLRFVTGDNPDGIDREYYDTKVKYEDYPDNVESTDDPNQGWALAHKDKGTFLGYCSNCGAECWSENGAYEDYDEVFCSSFCAEEYHEYDEEDN